MTNAEARFNNSLRPRKLESSLGRTAQDGHLDSHTAPELWNCCWSLLCSAILRSREDLLRLHLILHEWLAFYSAYLNSHRSGVLRALTWLVPRETAAVSATWVTIFLQRVFESVHRSGVLTALSWLVPHETAAVWVRSVYTIQHASHDTPHSLLYSSHY